MKKLTILAILTLLGSGLALAQSPQDMGNASTPGVTFTTGVVVSSSTDHLIIRNDVGELVTVFLDDSTVGAKDRTAGTRVKINFHLEDGRAIADEILGFQGEPEPTVTTPPVVVTSTTPVVETAPPAAVVPPPPPAPAPEVVTEMPPSEPAPSETSTYEAQDSPEALPATASNQGLIALIGLLALAAAIVVRVVR